MVAPALSAETAILWSGRIISVAVALQAIELFQLKPTWISGGIWDWEIIREELGVFPRPLRPILDGLLDERGLTGVLAALLLAASAGIVFPHPMLMGILWLGSALVAIRWRGSFNGGSDSMTLIVTGTLTVAGIFRSHPKVVMGCLGYTAFQACLSYFVAGVAKLRIADWRNGRALPLFLNSTYYDVPRRLRALPLRSGAILTASWGVMGFECAFPMALWRPELCMVFIGLGMAFHLANVYVLGLNRFLFAWAAAYPALYFWSQAGILG